MLIVALAFTVIFMFRDVQVLAVRDRKPLALRFGGYATLFLGGIAIFAAFASSRAGWMERRFALAAVVVQLAELSIGLALQRRVLGHYNWIGLILPSPALLVALYVLSFEVQDRFPAVSVITAIEFVAAAWLLTVAGLVSILRWMDNPWEDQRFACDFALMTGCAALIFVPFGLS